MNLMNYTFCRCVSTWTESPQPYPLLELLKCTRSSRWIPFYFSMRVLHLASILDFERRSTGMYIVTAAYMLSMTSFCHWRTLMSFWANSDKTAESEDCWKDCFRAHLCNINITYKLYFLHSQPQFSGTQKGCVKFFYLDYLDLMVITKNLCCETATQQS